MISSALVSGACMSRYLRFAWSSATKSPPLSVSVCVCVYKYYILYVLCYITYSILYKIDLNTVDKERKNYITYIYICIYIYIYIHI